MAEKTIPKSGETDSRTDAKVAALSEHLGDYPEDAVLIAIGLWPSKSKWWPSEFELHEDIEAIDAALRRRPLLPDDTRWRSELGSKLFVTHSMLANSVPFRKETQDALSAWLAYCQDLMSNQVGTDGDACAVREYAPKIIETIRRIIAEYREDPRRALRKALAPKDDPWKL